MSPSASPATCTVTKVRICSEEKVAFGNWQANFHEAIVAFPGFVSLEILSPSGSDSHEWGIVERFVDAPQLANWRRSEQRQHLFDELHSFLKDKSLAAINEVPFEIDNQHGSVTEVFVTEVSPEKEMLYRQWISKIHQVEALFPGFRGVYVQAPSPGGGKNWITLLQFDTPEHLDNWLSSEERRQVLDESKSMVVALESHRMVSPFAGWFSSVSKGIQVPPAWKQGMIVLLVLFPIVMLEMKFLSPWTASLNPSLAMFIGNVISVALVTWPTVPAAIKLLGWWLTPASKNRWKVNVGGTFLVVLLYAVEVAIFWAIKY